MRINKEFLKPSNIVLIIIGISFAFFAPHFLTGYTYVIINVALIYVLCVYGASVLTGMGGQMSFAYVTFMAVGAYYVANLSTGRLGITVNPGILVLTAPVISGIIGFVVGLILFRLKGTFFVFGTLALVNITAIFFANYVPAFGGPNGIMAIPRLSFGALKIDSNLKWFYLLMGTTVIGYIIVERIRNTKLGRSLASVRDDESTALCLGINTYMTKVYAFTISSVFCGLAGAFYSFQNSFITADLFKFSNATLVIIMLMLGGMNHTVGAVIGALIVSILPESFRNLKSFLQIAYGLAIVLLMVFAPSGIAGMGEKFWERIKSIWRKKRVVRNGRRL